MKSSLLFTLAAAGLLLASCSEYKKPEAAAVAAPDPAAATTAPTPVAPAASAVPDTIAFRDDARRLADRVAADLKLRDEVTKRRLQGAYFARRQRLADLDARYLADTAGRYAALRGLNDDTDREVRRILPSPVLVRTYESGRADYYDGPFTAAPAVVAAPAPARPARRGPRVVKYEKDRSGETKIEYSNGTKVKIEADGDRKIKYANDRKVKVEDGVRKVKD